MHWKKRQKTKDKRQKVIGKYKRGLIAGAEGAMFND